MRRPRIEGAVRADLNVTPLVDICLVLLIVFMVATPLVHANAAVELPQSHRPERFPEIERIVVTLAADGRIVVGTRRIDDRELTDVLTASVTANPDLMVVVEADRTLAYGRVRTLLDTIGASGVRHVGLATELRL